MSGLALASLAILGDASAAPVPFGGTPIPANWVPSGQEALAAEKMWWQVFQSQDYAATSRLYQQLTKGPSTATDPFTRALLHARLGWFYLWIGAEDGYVKPAHPPQTVPGVTFSTPPIPAPEWVFWNTTLPLFRSGSTRSRPATALASPGCTFAAPRIW